MFNFLKKLTKSKNENSKSFRVEMAKHLSGRAIKYCTERDPETGTDIVIGHAGSLSIKDDEFIVLSSADIVFRCKIVEMRAWELMSNDGAMITAPTSRMTKRNGRSWSTTRIILNNVGSPRKALGIVKIHKFV